MKEKGNVFIDIKIEIRISILIIDIIIILYNIYIFDRIFDKDNTFLKYVNIIYLLGCRLEQMLFILVMELKIFCQLGKNFPLVRKINFAFKMF